MKKKSVVLFGDSGLGRFNRDRIRKLEKASGNVDVYNCAVGGLNSRDGLEMASFIAKLEPDIVAFSFPANDIADGISIEETKMDMLGIIKAFKKSKIILFLYPNADERFREIPSFNERMAEYNLLLKELADLCGAKTIDGPQAYGKIKKEYHEDDGIHLNEYGYDILIGEMVKVIN